MLEQLEKDSIKIPSPLRNEMMSMLLQAWEALEIHTKREFKSLFATNALDGSKISYRINYLHLLDMKW